VSVLIAEDESVARMVLQHAVEQLGHEVFVAADGIQAWDFYRRHECDVVISDWMMPGLDGPELCRRVRAQPHQTYTYFILLTALDDKSHFIEGMQAGADDYLTKPFDREQLDVRLRVAERVTTLHRRLAEKTRELERANRSLAVSARRDPLTGLGNRRQLRDDLLRLQAWLHRYGRGFAVALCDVDHFKLYNDRFGHLAGDDVLRTVSRTVATTVRSGDMTYRYGGEELLIIMPEQTAETSIVAMERIRSAIERLAISHPDNSPHRVVTMSIGLVTIGAGEQRPWESVLSQADEALYRAKAWGRNLVALAEPPLLGLVPDLDLCDDEAFFALDGPAPSDPASSPPG
jgi:diguanylate cyclase (GGDEF)-like protein